MKSAEGKTNPFLLQAIELSAESLANVKFIQEKKLIGKYFDEISQDTGKYCFGVDDTLKALEMGAVETLICWENRDIQVILLLNTLSRFTQHPIYAINNYIRLIYILFAESNTEESQHWRGKDPIPEQRAGEGQDPLHGQGVRGGARARG